MCPHKLLDSRGLILTKTRIGSSRNDPRALQSFFLTDSPQQSTTITSRSCL